MPEHLSKRLVNWASVLDDKTRRQAETTSSMPFMFPHLALMPDAHLGKGATVGSVIPTLGAIIPAAVGVDIGCGMIAVRTQFSAHAVREAGDLGVLRKSIEGAIPLSAGRSNPDLTESAALRVAELRQLNGAGSADVVSSNWPRQLGSLGSGNHFVEVTADETDTVWLFLHSGSRGVGNKLAQKHIAVAQRECDRWWIDLPDPDLAYLVEGTDEFRDYITDLRWAQHFARLNRDEMMDRLIGCLSDFMNDETRDLERIDCHHNFTQRERHFGCDVWLSRKGAIEARPGQAGLIPGSMGTASYVVEGKGDAVSLNSSPHGAGRSYSRSAARKRFTLDELRAAMSGIEYRDSAAFLDEIPAAYKDIDVVMADAADLVSTRHTLRQLVNVKGD